MESQSHAIAPANMNGSATSNGILGEQVHKRSGHVLWIPSTSHSHITSSFRMAVQLAKQGLMITFVSSQKCISKIESSYYSSPESASAEFKNISLVRLADVNVNDDPFVVSRRLKVEFQPYLDKLLADRKAGVGIAITCVLHDVFALWAKDVATQLEVPSYVFYSNGAIFARFMTAIHQLRSEGKLSVVEGLVTRLDDIVKLQGLQWCRTRDLPWAIHLLFEDYAASGEETVKAAGVVINTFFDLEAGPLDAIRKACSGDSQWQGPKIFPVGPISSAASSTTNVSFVAGLEVVGNESFRWLEAQPASSVLFICLGSVARLNPRQIKELALALEHSHRNFLWVLPSGRGNFTSLEEVLPVGYQGRVRGRGIIASGWVDQMKVLSHPSIGAFLSHCGWASILESMSAGVPILAWPFGAEQHLNARYVVEEVKIAIAVTDKRDDAYLGTLLAVRLTGKAAEESQVVEQGEFESAIEHMMVHEEGKAMRERAQQLKAKVAASLAAGGHSRKALEDLAHHINCL